MPSRKPKKGKASNRIKTRSHKRRQINERLGKDIASALSMQKHLDDRGKLKIREQKYYGLPHCPYQSRGCDVIGIEHRSRDIGLFSRSLFQYTRGEDRKSTRLNSSHVAISYAVFCLKK